MIKLTYPRFILTKEEQEEFDYQVKLLTDNGIQVQPQDATAVGMLAAAIVDYRVARLDIAARGASLTVSGDKGSTITKANPSLELAKKAEVTIKTYTHALQMNPATRKATIVDAIDDEDDPLAKRFNKRKG